MSSLKGLREHLCQAQTNAAWPGDIDWAVDELIHMIDRHRPLASDGTHGDLHTSTCGCQDKPPPSTAILTAPRPPRGH